MRMNDYVLATQLHIEQLISSRMDRATATETVASGSIPVGLNQRLENYSELPHLTFKKKKG